MTAAVCAKSCFTQGRSYLSNIPDLRTAAKSIAGKPAPTRVCGVHKTCGSWLASDEARPDTTKFMH
ncbi:hypothetical protein FCH79_24225 [Pseudomonas koreensis]|nr:hypothetical protein [Pseudomonas koreensis]